ncbi:hypothetical protein [Amycolatopsis sp. w19]|uniref:hypothetical protein n=1 Tax=Amycolatopsis sp. w19 TaxID=3448134 RepID=UPI003F1DB193
MPSRPHLYDLLALLTVVVAGVSLFIAGARAADLSTAALAMSNLYARWNMRGHNRLDSPRREVR